MREPFFHRYFLALRPPRSVVPEIGLWRDSFLFGGRPVDNDRLHITMFMLGNFDRPPARLLARVQGAIAAASLPACRVVLDTLTGGAGSALLAPSEKLAGVERLQARIAALLAQSDVRAAPWWRFSPHVTLLYDHNYAGHCLIDPISWTAGELVLVESRIGQSRHVVRAAWPLAAPIAAALAA